MVRIQIRFIFSVTSGEKIYAMEKFVSTGDDHNLNLMQNDNLGYNCLSIGV